MHPSDAAVLTAGTVAVFVTALLSGHPYVEPTVLAFAVLFGAVMVCRALPGPSETRVLGVVLRRPMPTWSAIVAVVVGILACSGWGVALWRAVGGAS